MIGKRVGKGTKERAIALSFGYTGKMSEGKDDEIICRVQAMTEWISTNHATIP